MFPERPIDTGSVEARLPLLADKLSAFPEVGAAYLFGSFARGKPGKLSDVDIALLLEEPARGRGGGSVPEYVAAVMGVLATNRVDVVVLNAAPLALRHAVFRDGRLHFARDAGALARFRESSIRSFLDTAPLRRTYAAAYFRRVREHGFGRRSSSR